MEDWTQDLVQARQTLSCGTTATANVFASEKMNKIIFKLRTGNNANVLQHWMIKHVGANTQRDVLSNKKVQTNDTTTWEEL